MKNKFYTLKELAKLYGISVQTLKRRLVPLRDELNTIGDDEDGEPIMYYYNKILYSPKQVKLIVKYFGEPDEAPDDNVEKKKK